MSIRLGPGPVFAYEWLIASRRWQPYAIRAGFVGVILIGMAISQGSVTARGPDHRVSLGDMALFGQNLYKVVAWIELTLILLVAPAVTAGAICLDRARGTLDHMLATDLSNAEIVLGKLGVRLIPVLGLIAGAVPVLALAGLMGGIDPMALLGLFQVSIGCAVAGCALAMVLSLYGRKTHEVVMMAYLLLIGWFVAPLLLEILIQAMSSPLLPIPPPGAPPLPPPAVPPRWLILLHDSCNYTHPFMLALAPYAEPAPPGEARYLGFLAGCLAASAAMVLLATARVRRVAMKQAARPASDGRRRLLRGFPRLRLPGPSLDGNPVAWREWHRGRASMMMKIAWGMYAVLGLGWFGLAAWSSRRDHVGNDNILVGYANIIQVTIGLLLLCVSASSGLAEERASGGLDVLLSTPMSTRSILAGKWWGSFRRVLGVVIWPAAMTAFFFGKGGYWIGYLLLLGLVLSHGAAITSLGLLMASWVSRPGRAIAACVAIHVLLMIGWPILLFYGLRVDRTIGQPLLTGDPPVGVLFATMATSPSGLGRIAPGASRGEIFLWASGWNAILGLAATGLFLAAAATFDRCLGRVPEDGPGPPPRPRPRMSPPVPAPSSAVVSQVG